MTKTGRTTLTLSSLAAALLLSACGGGGDSGTTPGAGTAYPLQSGYKALILAGQNNNLAVTGTCTGTATFTASPAVAATFEGVGGFSSLNVLNGTLNNCVVGSLSINATNYYDSNATPIGSVSPAVSYTTFATLPPALPASVRVGDAGTMSNLTVYTDSTKATVAGRVLFSYSVEADTASTAILNLVSQGYNGANALVVTQLTRYRISADGSLALVAIDLQYSLTSTNHFQLTKI